MSLAIAVASPAPYLANNLPYTYYHAKTADHPESGLSSHTANTPQKSPSQQGRPQGWDEVGNGPEKDTTLPYLLSLEASASSKECYSQPASPNDAFVFLTYYGGPLDQARKACPPPSWPTWE